MDLEKQSEPSSKETSESSLNVESDPLALSQHPVNLLKVDQSALWKRPSFYGEGNGVKLKHIPGVITNIEVAPDSFIEILHRLLYLHIDEKPNMRHNILEFSGIKCENGTINYLCRMRILSNFSVQQLALIYDVLCLPLCQYSRQFMVENILNFLHVPQIISMKERVSCIPAERFAISFDCGLVDEIILNEAKHAETEEMEIFPDIHSTEKSSYIPSKESLLTFDNTKPAQVKISESKHPETAEMELVSNIQVHEQTSLVSLHGHLPSESDPQTFSKLADVPNVLQACQNYDYRYQRELLKSGVTLALNSDEYLEHAITNEEAAFRLACAKYMRNYHSERRQRPSKMSPGQQFQETEEQAATRRAQNALRMRNYRQNLRAVETEEQAADRRAQNALRMRNYRRFKRELEPEMAAERRALNAQRMREHRKVKRELEPELAAIRRAQNALRMRNYRKNKRQQEPE